MARAISTEKLKTAGMGLFGPTAQRAPYAMSCNDCLEPGSTPNEDYFRFTGGRFVCDEEYEMSQRYVLFDMHGLGRIAAKALGSKSCVGVEKYPDGMFNKALLLSMDDGAQAVAKIPNPNAGRPHMTTASEVATMEFVCIITNAFPE